MLGILRAKRVGGFFNKPVKEQQLITKTKLYRQVNPSEKINTRLPNQSPSHVPFRDLDRRMAALKSTYCQYNQDEQNLEKNLKQLSDRNKKLIKRLQLFLEAYNQALVSLRAFDDAFGTNYIEAIENLLRKDKERIEMYGLFVEPTCEIYFDPDRFLSQIMQDNTVYPYLFNSNYGFFVKLCHIFRHIRIPTSHNKHHANADMKGTILDHRS